MNHEAMRAAAAEIEDSLEQALEMLGQEHEGFLTPEAAAGAARLATGYVVLARIALERFEEAARG